MQEKLYLSMTEINRLFLRAFYRLHISEFANFIVHHNIWRDYSRISNASNHSTMNKRFITPHSQQAGSNLIIFLNILLPTLFLYIRLTFFFGSLYSAVVHKFSNYIPISNTNWTLLLLLILTIVYSPAANNNVSFLPDSKSFTGFIDRSGGFPLYPPIIW